MFAARTYGLEAGLAELVCNLERLRSSALPTIQALAATSPAFLSGATSTLLLRSPGSGARKSTTTRRPCVSKESRQKPSVVVEVVAELNCFRASGCLEFSRLVSPKPYPEGDGFGQKYKDQNTL